MPHVDYASIIPPNPCASPDVACTISPTAFSQNDIVDLVGYGDQLAYSPTIHLGWPHRAV